MRGLKRNFHNDIKMISAIDIFFVKPQLQKKNIEITSFILRALGHSNKKYNLLRKNYKNNI